jgi:hypothetical protein
VLNRQPYPALKLLDSPTNCKSLLAHLKSKASAFQRQKNEDSYNL